MNNTFGNFFKVTTFGESHGFSIGCIIDGCPSNIKISKNLIQNDLDRRKPGTSYFVSQRKEDDKLKILSGIFKGKSTGAPIALIINNNDQKPKDYKDIKNIFRPGHADYVYFNKYKHRDYRGGGRSSARETAVRVAAGSIAKQCLKKLCNIKIRGAVNQIGSIVAKKNNWKKANNIFNFLDNKKVNKIKLLIQKLIKLGDSIGAKILVEAENVPKNLGEPIFKKLDSEIASSMMSIPGVKAVGIGNGLNCIKKKGSQNNDQISSKGFLKNDSGGILGGISTGQKIFLEVIFKPTSSIKKKLKSITIDNNDCEFKTNGRHDPCIGIRAVPIVESMLALVILDYLLISKMREI